MGELVSITGQEKLAKVVLKLKEAGGETEKGLRSELRKGLRKSATPMLRAVQDRVRSISVKGVKGGGKWARYFHKPKARGGIGLRATVASAMQVQVKTTGNPQVTLRVNSSRLPADQRNLPDHMNKASGWRHPVFGDNDVWAQQLGEPYWEPTLNPFGPKVRSEMIETVDSVLRRIDG
jgi:hypothetical protein